jgi:hypothetical protein
MDKGTVAAAVAALAGIGAWLLFRPREASATTQAKTSQPSKPASKPAAAAPAKPAPTQAPAAPTAPATSSAVPDSLPSTGRYETALDAIAAPDWVKVSTLPGRLVTRLPLLTTGPERAKGVTYARATQVTTKTIADKFGARAPTIGEMQAIAQAPEVRIVSMCNQPAGDSMASLEWARRHDECVRKKIGDAPQDGVVYFTVGKHWVEPLSEAAIYGFFKRDGDPNSVLQANARTSHKPSPHVDYSQTVFLVKDLEAS